MKKSFFIRKRRTVLLIRICSAVLALYMLYLGIGTLLNIGNIMISFQSGGYSALHKWSSYSLDLLCGAFTLLAAFIFGSVAKTGMPFSDRLSKMTFATGIIMIVSDFLPRALEKADRFDPRFMMPHTFVMELLHNWEPLSLIGVLLLMLALVMRYGAMLQQESDETL